MENSRTTGCLHAAISDILFYFRGEADIYQIKYQEFFRENP